MVRICCIVAILMASLSLIASSENFVFYPVSTVSGKQSVVESIGSSNAANVTCDFVKMVPFLFNFFQNFGYNDTYEPESSNDFSNKLYSYVDGIGVSGWDDVRDWLYALTDGSGLDNFNACIQWQQWQMWTNVSTLESKNWQIQFTQLQYNLGPAYAVFTHNWYCIEGVAVHSNPQIQICVDQFGQNEQNNPSDHCGNLVTYLYCYDRPFSTACGAQAGGVVCYNELITYQIYDPQCQTQVTLHCRGAPPPIAPALDYNTNL